MSEPDRPPLQVNHLEMNTTGPEYSMAMLRALDTQLHPWGKPGEWPEAGADVWVLYCGKVYDTDVILIQQEQEDESWVWVASVCFWEETFAINDPDPDVKAMRFRARWTPEVP